MRLQLNVLNRSSLLEARQDLAKHPGLLVRVAGYSARLIAVLNAVPVGIWILLDSRNRSLLLSQTVVVVGGLEQAEDDRSLEVRGAALVFELATNGASDAVFIHLADVLKQVAGLGAPVIPLLEELLEPRSVGAEASGPLQTIKSSCHIPLSVWGR